MPFVSQIEVVMVELDAAAASGKYTNKIQIITAVSDSLHLPRSTVRQAKAKLLRRLYAKVRILEADE